MITHDWGGYYLHFEKLLTREDAIVSNGKVNNFIYFAPLLSITHYDLYTYIVIVM